MKKTSAAIFLLFGGKMVFLYLVHVNLLETAACYRG